MARNVEDMRTTQISLYLTAEELEKLDKIAAELNVSRQIVIDRYVTNLRVPKEQRKVRSTIWLNYQIKGVKKLKRPYKTTSELIEKLKRYSATHKVSYSLVVRRYIINYKLKWRGV